MARRKITEEQAREAYERTGSYAAAGRLLGVNPSVIKLRVDPTFVERRRQYNDRWYQSERGQATARAARDRRTASGSNRKYLESWTARNPGRARAFRDAWYAKNKARCLTALKERAAARKALGLCMRCSQPALAAHTRCAYHAEEERAYSRNKSAQREKPPPTAAATQVQQMRAARKQTP